MNIRNIFLISFLAIILLGSSLGSSSAKPDDAKKPPVVASLKKLKDPQSVILEDGTIVEKTTHVFYKENISPTSDDVRNDKKPKPPKGLKSSTKCFSFDKGERWKTTEPYFINPTNRGPLSSPSIVSDTQLSVDKWDDLVRFNIFGDGHVDLTKMMPINSEGIPVLDNENGIVFGSIDNENVIAVTITWGIFGSTPSRNIIVEWDILLNDADFNFGNAGPTNEEALGDTSIMDYENIISHELGHSAGMGHPPVKDTNGDGSPDADDPCRNETMFLLAENGETKKRTLNPGDKTGIKRLY